MPGRELLFGIIVAISWILFIHGGWYLVGRFIFWEKLAQHYRATREPAGKAWLGSFGSINHFGFLLELMTDENGIYIETGNFLWFEYPRIFIPWQEFHSPILRHWAEQFPLRQFPILQSPVWLTRRSRHLEPMVELQVGNLPKTTLRLPLQVFTETAGRKVLEQLPIGTNVPAP